MTDYERAVLFEKPDAIPMRFSINDACWKAYDQNALFDLMESHKYLFPDFERPEGENLPEYKRVAREDQPYTDDFGCVWMTSVDGLTGTVKGHPLENWELFASYRFPDPEICMDIGPVDWEKEKSR